MNNDTPHRRPPAPSLDRRAVLRSIGGLSVLGAAGAATRFVDRDSDVSQLEQDDMSGLGTGQDRRLGHHRVIWSAEIDRPVCSLTFDDGPDPEFTPKVLEALKSFGITATFNVMGWNALHHTDLLLEVLAAGHEIGNHTWSHKDLSTTSYADTEHEIVYGKQIIERLSGRKLLYFRPPRGELTGAALRIAAGVGHDVLLWSLTGSLPGTEHPDEVRNFVLRKLAPGHIIDLHDGIGRGTFDRGGATAKGLIQRRSAEVAALPHIIETALQRGYSFTSVTQLLTLEATAA